MCLGSGYYGQVSQVREICEVCGFEWDAIAPDEIAPRIIDAMCQSSELIARNQKRSRDNFNQNQWSALEYGCHMRDVLYNIRDKIILITVEENPASLPLYGIPRVELGLYKHDKPEVLALEMRLAGELFARTFLAIPEASYERVFLYRYPRETMRNLKWVAAQALHECEHHAEDIRELLET
jgi:hypothetical protein